MASPRLNPDKIDGDTTLNVISPAQLLTQSVGPLFIGYNISAALFGLICAQACLYFKRHSQDFAWIKSIAVVLLLLETFHIAFVTHGVFVCAVSNHGNFGCFSRTPRTIVVCFLSLFLEHQPTRCMLTPKVQVIPSVRPTMSVNASCGSQLDLRLWSWQLYNMFG